MASHGHKQVSAGKPSGAFARAWDRKWSFLGVFLFVLFTSVGVLGVADLLPESQERVVKDAGGSSLSAAASLSRGQEEEPVKIEIPALDLAVEVLNPETRDVATLDRALLEGVVRYPTSSNLGETGNVIIFGHSSYLPVVRNRAFKAFNGIQDLEEDERIYVSGRERTYVYAVEQVFLADAEEDAIPLDVSGSKLTLATCDSFGTKSDRYIVVANLVESYPVGN